MICSLVSLEELYQEVAGGLSPSRKVLDLGLDIEIKRLDIIIEMNHLGIQLSQGGADEGHSDLGVDVRSTDNEL
jgi:hypothetical protein